MIVLNGSGLTYLIMAFNVPFCHTDDLGDSYCGPRYYDSIDTVVYALVPKVHYLSLSCADVPYKALMAVQSDSVPSS